VTGGKAMNGKTRSVLAVVSLCFLLGSAYQAEAISIDSKDTFTVTGKAQTRATLRLNDAEGYTYPDVQTGDLVQHRNLAILEVNHDLKYLKKDLDILYPFRALNLNVKYHVVGRFLYEGIYDYGPGIFQDVRDADKTNIDEFKQSYDLWECYADISRGPFFMRIGKQNLAWGETDIFRLLDGINPLDNTFGGPFEDLDDRRIPLWMLRSSLNLGMVGPISSISLEGFLVPGKIDAHVGPFAPFGTAYSAPLPALFVPSLRIITPDRKWSESRWGARLQALLFDKVNVSVAHYQTFLDMPTLRSYVVGSPEILSDLNQMQLWGEFPEVRITGASLNYWDPLSNTVFRSEVAWFWNEPVFIPEINNATLFGEQLELPDPILDLAAQLLGVDIRDLGLRGLPLNPKSGTIPRKDILRYMFGFDKQMWIRPLNKTNTFFLSGQYFGQYVPEYDSRMRQAALIYPSLKDYASVKRFEHVFTFMINTMYMKGNLQPQFALAWDVRGTMLIQPSVNFIHEPFRFMLQYSAIEGNFTNFGAFRDRDQIALIVSYLLN